VVFVQVTYPSRVNAWTARGGWSIEVVVRHGRPGYRVLRYGHLMACCASLEDLAERLQLYGLDLGDLVEDDPACE
jgi:hypothetical protein